jgi:hypothetical protein
MQQRNFPLCFAFAFTSSSTCLDFLLKTGNQRLAFRLLLPVNFFFNKLEAVVADPLRFSIVSNRLESFSRPPLC